MVNLTSVCFKYMPFWLRRPESRGPFFKRQALFRMTGTFYGRSRNVFRVSIGKFVKKMEYQAEFRGRRRIHMTDLFSQRLLAAVEEHDFKIEYFLSSLVKSNIELTPRALSLIAIYEPRTFKSLVDLAKTTYHENPGGERAEILKPPGTVMTRGLIKHED